MSWVRKVIISLLITSFLFGLGVIFFHQDILDLASMYLYQPKRIQYYNAKSDLISTTFNKYFEEVNEVFADFVVQKSVSSFMEAEVSEKDIRMRQSLSEYLFVRLNYLEGIRLIENDGNKIYYSTYEDDKKGIVKGQVLYKDYPKLNEIPFYIIEAPDEGIVADSVATIMESCHLYLDGKHNRFVFSYPLYDQYTAHRGTFVFYLSVNDFVNYLNRNDVIALGERAQIVGNKGIVFNLSTLVQNLMLARIEDLWNVNRFGMQRLMDGETSESTYIMFSQNRNLKNICIGLVCNEADLELSKLTRMFLLFNLYVSFSLVVLLILNLKRDPIAVISEKIRKLQFALLRDYIDRRSTEDWKVLSHELAQRRIEFTEEFKKDLGSIGKKYSTEIDARMDETWHFISTVAAMDKTSGIPILAAADSKNAFTPSRFPSYVVEDLPVLSDDGEDVEMLESVDDDYERQVTEISIPNDSRDEEIEELESIDDEGAAELEPLDLADDEIEELESVGELEPVEEEAERKTLPTEDSAQNENPVKIEEITFDEYLKINYMIKELDESADRERIETEENFPVLALDFSSLDEWESQEEGE